MTAKEFISNCGLMAKGLVKIAVESRRCGVGARAAGRRLIIMANGPSLAGTMRDCAASLLGSDLMAVNFAANSDEFYRFRPSMYVLADPHFFSVGADPNVDRLWHNLASKVNWPLTLYIPARMRGRLPDSVRAASHLATECFNPVGVEGFGWFERMAYSTGRAMPRPRNVLICAIMIALKAGYREIFLTGADHSWTRTLEVDEHNRLISVQPHFYKENESETTRVAHLYSNIPIHRILLSFHIAFKAYHKVRRYADSIGAEIWNSTPGSFIDAFKRRSLPEDSTSV